jgi:peroxiredoxin
MKRRGIWPVAAAFVLAALGASAPVAGDEAAGAPDFVLKSVAGANLRLSEYRGRVVMLSFWATWCGECRSQLEGLAELYGRYEGAGFEVLAVSLDSDIDDTSETAAGLDVGFPVLHDAGGRVGELYSVDSVPLVVIVDRDGNVRERFEGYRRGHEERYLDRVRALLDE